MSVEPVKPDYDGAWIGGVVPALSAPVAPDWLPDVAGYAQRVVLLVIDGLGWDMLRANAAHLPTLAAMDGRAITCGVPSSTAVGLPCITTGLTPGEHGLLGYRMGLEDGVLNVLRWRMDGGGKGPVATGLQPVQAFGGAGVPTVVRDHFEHTGFTDAHLSGGTFDGYQTPAVLRTAVAGHLAAGSRVVYAYYDGVDKVAHPHGLTGPKFLAELEDADRLVSQLLDVIPSDGALVVTADHGHVAVGPDAIISLDPVSRWVKRMAGESRFRTLWATPNHQADLLAACEDLWGDVAWVFSRERLVDEGWLGPIVPAHHARRVGDVILAPREDVGFADPATPGEDQMASRHGSLTRAEMLVPLVAAAGRAGR